MRALFPTLMTAAALALLATGPAQAADCSAARGCAAKFCQIENDIAQAQAHGNSRQEAGLRRALAEARRTAPIAACRTSAKPTCARNRTRSPNAKANSSRLAPRASRKRSTRPSASWTKRAPNTTPHWPT